MAAGRLEELLRQGAERWPDAVAVRDAGRGGERTYAALWADAEALAARLRDHGVRPGDRVAIRMPKSVDSVAAIFGALGAGAAYVPLDASAPAARNERIAALAGAAAVVTPGACGGAPAIAGGPGGEAGAPELSYLLFTSGSTGEPKGVVHTHASARSFVDWAVERFAPRPEDRFASHAPLHFDLSIFDLYVPLAAGATLVLFDEGLGRLPTALAEAIDARRISVWYSTPSTLRMLLTYGRMERFDYQALRLVLYAGEVFAANQLAALRERWPRPRYFNLYGPTETNVCTCYEVPATWPPERSEPFPIGSACAGDEARVIDADGRELGAGAEGELVVRGGTLMAGYWGRPEATAAARWRDADGREWYRTGDLVRDLGDGVYTFLGRRDRMVKRHGFRIELGEIEVALGTMEGVTEAAAVARPHPDQGVEIVAFVTTEGGLRPSLVAFRGFAARHLPASMIPDRFEVVEALPRTSTGKIDLRTLEGMA